jgi:Spy/CpxP family protein refolding chaperone
MNRGWIIALLLSLGMNVGLVVSTIVRSRQSPHRERDHVERRLGERQGGRRQWNGQEGRSRPERDSEDADSRAGEEPGFQLSDRHLQRLAERLGIEGETRDRFIVLQRDFWRESRSRHQAVDAARRSLHEALSAPNPDPELVEGRLEASSQASAEMERALVEHVLAARSLLEGEPEKRYLRFLEDLTDRRSRGGHDFRRPRR